MHNSAHTCTHSPIQSHINTHIHRLTHTSTPTHSYAHTSTHKHIYHNSYLRVWNVNRVVTVSLRKVEKKQQLIHAPKESLLKSYILFRSANVKLRLKPVQVKVPIRPCPVCKWQRYWASAFCRHWLCRHQRNKQTGSEQLVTQSRGLPAYLIWFQSVEKSSLLSSPTDGLLTDRLLVLGLQGGHIVLWTTTGRERSQDTLYTTTGREKVTGHTLHDHRERKGHRTHFTRPQGEKRSQDTLYITTGREKVTGHTLHDHRERKGHRTHFT